MSGFWRLLVLVAVGAGLSGQSGCVWKGEPGESVEGEGPVAWRAEPVRLRVYPATRYVREGARSVLEARIELLDELSDSVKGAGKFHLELFAQDLADEVIIGRQLYSWDVSLLTLADQQRYYDPITRAYLFRLKLEGEELPQRGTVLRVMFVPVEGARLSAKAALPGGVRQAGVVERELPVVQVEVGEPGAVD